MPLDIAIFNLINSLAGKSGITDQIGIFLANYLGYFLILLAALLIFTRKNWQQRFYFFSLTALSVILSWGIITQTIKFFYQRVRPFSALQIQSLIEHSPGSSFPSGHTAFFFALAFAVFFIHKRWGWRFLGAAFVIGLARIFVGVHWPLDIIAGAIIGIASVLLIKKLLPSPSQKIKNPAYSKI